MKWLAAALAVAVILLQYRVWFSADGVREVERLKGAVATQLRETLSSLFGVGRFALPARAWAVGGVVAD